LKLVHLLTVFAALTVCFTTPAFADTIAVSNPSFEITNPLTLPCGVGCTFNPGPIPGWTLTGLGGSFHPNGSFFSLPLPDGSIVAYSNGGTISQTTSTSLTANTTYTLSVDVGRRFDAGVNNFTLALYAGNTILQSLTLSNSLIPLGGFVDESFSYTSGTVLPSGNLRIALTTAGPQQVNYDNVRLTASPVPEPTSLALLAAGLGLVIFVLRRR
jgi:hypothetical protein